MPKTMAICLIVFAVSCFICQPTAWGKLKQLTDDDLNYEKPQIDNGQVVFQSEESGEIYFWNGENVTELSFALPGYHEYPRIHSGKIVWHGTGRDGDVDTEIYYYDSNNPQNGIIQLTDNDYDDTFPMISGTLVVWESDANEPGDYHRIRYWRGGGIGSFGSPAAYNRLLDVSGDFIVYVTGSLLGPKKLISYNTKTSGQFLNESYGADEHIEKAVAYNGYAVWQVLNTQSDIRTLYYFDWGAGYYTVKKITEGRLEEVINYYDRAPFGIHKNLVVWKQWVNNNADIFVWDANNNSTTEISESIAAGNRSPSIHDGIIAWQGFTGLATDIFIFKDGKATNITNNNRLLIPEVYDFNPMVNSGDVVWNRFVDNSYEIILYDDFDDIDGDGIDDDIDKDPEIHSDYFDDNEIDINGITSGQIIDRTCYPMIMDAMGYDEGVVVEGIGCKNPYDSIIWACNNAYIENISSDYKFVVTCGSANISVLDGSVKTSLEGNNGQTVTANLIAGNTLMFDEIDFELTAPLTNTEPVIVISDGKSVTIQPGDVIDLENELQDKSLLEFFDQSVDDGMIYGLGKSQHKSGLSLQQFERILDKANSFIDKGKVNGACAKLKIASLKCDGIKGPKDLIDGPASSALNGLILYHMGELGCR